MRTASWRTTGEKNCYVCKVLKPVSDFYLWRGVPVSKCKSCSSKRSPKRMAQRAAYTRKWLQDNRERHAEWKRERLRASPAARVKGRVYGALRRAISGKGKYLRTFEHLGYSLQELVCHLEKQFQKGMSWDEADKWHIDHIIPLSEFGITGFDDPNLKRAWALSNLRPLWASENCSKSDKRLHLI